MHRKLLGHPILLYINYREYRVDIASDTKYSQFSPFAVSTILGKYFVLVCRSRIITLTIRGYQ